MTVPEIIAALTSYTGIFPEEAVKAAMEQHEAVAPHLVLALEEVAETPEKFASQEQMLHLYAAYLLAQFRDKRAYRPLARILVAPGDISDKLFGDTITERIQNILASVYDGDPDPIKQIVERDNAYEFARGAALETFMVLVHTGQIPRQDVVEYYRSLFHEKLRREYCHVWNALVCAVADLPAPELIEEMRKAYEDDLVDPSFADFEDLEHEARVPFDSKPQYKKEGSSYVGDVISEMEWWAAFHHDEEEPGILDSDDDTDIEPDPLGFNELTDDELDNPIASVTPSPVIRSGPKIGRNDPCPCGSGKKYKKCCLGK